MKKTAVLVFCLCLLLSLAGCGSSGRTAEPTATPEPEPTAAPEPEPAEEPTPEAAAPQEAGFTPEFTFSAVDREGREWTEQTFAGYELTMINFWEPWCPPCVGEMPDLQKLSEKYADRGFQILGVYSEKTMESEVDELIQKSGVAYPLLRYVSDFDRFQSGYVPTTVFVDKQGHILSVNGEQLIVGSNSLEGWSAIVEGLL